MEAIGNESSPALSSVYDDTVQFQYMVRFQLETDCFVVPVCDTILIGRSFDPHNDGLNVNLIGFSALDLGVSRRHARITAKDGNLYAVDLGSTNGTFLNCLRLQANREYLLHPGDDLQLGSLKMQVFWNQPVPSTRD